jgi:hypothetical protein
VVLAVALYNHHCFGSPFSIGYGHLQNPQFADGMSHGIFGVTHPRPGVLLDILIGRDRGLVWFSPFVLFAVPGALAWHRSGRRAELWVCGGVVAFYLLLNASYYLWSGGAAVGPRHCTAMLPFVFLVCSGGVAESPRLALALGATSILCMTGTVAVGTLPPENQSVLFDYVIPHLWNGEVALIPGSANVGVMLGLPGVASLLPLLAAIAGTVIWFTRIGDAAADPTTVRS